MDKQENNKLKQILRKRVAENETYRDLLFGVLDPFTTEEIIYALLTRDSSKMELIKKIIDL